MCGCNNTRLYRLYKGDLVQAPAIAENILLIGVRGVICHDISIGLPLHIGCKIRCVDIAVVGYAILRT